MRERLGCVDPSSSRIKAVSRETLAWPSSIRALLRAVDLNSGEYGGICGPGQITRESNDHHGPDERRLSTSMPMIALQSLGSPNPAKYPFFAQRRRLCSRSGVTRTKETASLLCRSSRVVGRSEGDWIGRSPGPGPSLFHKNHRCVGHIYKGVDRILPVVGR